MLLNENDQFPVAEKDLLLDQVIWLVVGTIPHMLF